MNYDYLVGTLARTIKATGSFSAYKSTAQGAGATTKVNYPTEENDVSSWYSSTGSKFTPLRKGKYRFSAGALLTPAIDQKSMSLWLYKNGAAFKRLGKSVASGTTGIGCFGSAAAVANGTSDYFEIYVTHTLGTTTSVVASGQASSYFQAEFVGTT